LSEVLMLADPRGRAETLEMAFAALNSVEMASLSWSIFQFSGFHRRHSGMEASGTVP
jgi:glutathione S-transferase